MDLYLDSVDFKEIEAALDFGFIKGLTTTPTFMHRHGITDIDGAIVKLSGMVPELQVEALGDTPDEILAEAEGLDVVVVERPAELAVAETRVYDVVVHALETLDPRQERFDAVGVVQCTSPFTSPEDLAGAVALLERTGADSVVTVARIDSAVHPLKLKVLEGDRLLPYLEDDRLAPSQDLPPLWVRNGALYVTRRATLDSGELLGGDVRGYEMPAERSHDIDTPADLAIAELLLSGVITPGEHLRRARFGLRG